MTRIATTIALALAPAVAPAADVAGRYAIEGGGLQTCESFEEAARWRTEDLPAYGGWIEGYITAINQTAEGIYDVSPWQTTESSLSLLRSVCAQLDAETRLAEAVAELVRLYAPQALPTESEVLLIDADEATTLPIYVSTLDRMNAALRRRGHAVTDLPGHFGEDSRAALRDVQAEAGLAQTGLPDQRTLFVLLLAAETVTAPE